MGSYTDVAIAIDKEVYAKHALLKKIPKVLHEEPYIEVNGALHWYLESQKWYSDFAGVKGVHDFLELLEESEGIRPFTIAPGGQEFQRESYGMVLLHEDDTQKTYGEPDAYDLNPICYIDCPGRDAMLKKETNG